MFKALSNWKLTLTHVVFVTVLAIVAVDFDDLIIPEWSLFQESELSSSTEGNGAKAALLAMAGAATLFIALIPTKTDRRARLADLWLGSVGALATGSTGWFWLLSATEGDPGPYLLAIIPLLTLYLIIVFVSLCLNHAERQDKEWNEAGRPKLTLGFLVSPIVLLCGMTLAVVVAVFLPRWVF